MVQRACNHTPMTGKGQFVVAHKAGARQAAVQTL